MPSFWIHAKVLPNVKSLVSIIFLLNSLLKKTTKCLEKQNITTNYYLKIKLAIFVNFLDYVGNEIVTCIVSKLT